MMKYVKMFVLNKHSVFVKISMDPKVHYCKCGCSWSPGTFHRIIMLLRGHYTYRCSRCGTVMKFVLVHHVVKIESESIDKTELWRNG